MYAMKKDQIKIMELGTILNTPAWKEAFIPGDGTYHLLAWLPGSDN